MLNLPAHPYALTMDAPKKIGVMDDPQPELGPQDVRIRTLYSGISAGTEMAAYRGTSPFLDRKWNPDTRLFEAGAASLSYPMVAAGYEEVGEIEKVGADVTGLKPGDIIWGSWQHRSHYTVFADWTLARKLPDGLDPVTGIYSHIGAIALNAVLDARLNLGETVVIFGLGVPGLIAVQMAVASGADVIAVDPVPSRRQRALRYGAVQGLDSGEPDLAHHIRSLTGGRGADCAIEISGHYKALQMAIRSVAYNSRVVVSGFFQGDGIGLALGEEFHHNRIQLICSQISGQAADLQHRWDRARLNGTVFDLARRGKIDLLDLVTDRYPVAQADEAFARIDSNPGDILQTVLDFGGQNDA